MANFGSCSSVAETTALEPGRFYRLTFQLSQIPFVQVGVDEFRTAMGLAGQRLGTRGLVFSDFKSITQQLLDGTIEVVSFQAIVKCGGAGCGDRSVGDVISLFDAAIQDATTGIPVVGQPFVTAAAAESCEQEPNPDIEGGGRLPIVGDLQGIVRVATIGVIGLLGVSFVQAIRK